VTVESGRGTYETSAHHTSEHLVDARAIIADVQRAAIMSSVTHILSAIEQGDPSRAEELLPLHENASVNVQRCPEHYSPGGSEFSRGERPVCSARRKQQNSVSDQSIGGQC
jgi:hypothetical protein